ncbi:MAG: zinc-ribbon domain containing protein [Candidatus Berkelbacteria bacterium]|nr:zinc-ribbon domain containing protein [Candidatus Berkelbacteria bacterium]
MAENKTCKQCKKEFVVTDDDLAFYNKISPTFDGKVFEIPAPTLCPDCRNRRRLGVRNVTNLYKRKCDLCGREMVSMYSPDKTDLKVYCSDCWWSDKWSHSDFAQDYDPSKSFIEQITELKQKVPAPALMHAGDENSDYINLANDNKSCYLVFLSGRNEDTYYGYWSEDSKNCCDVSYNSFCELCYEGINLGRCYNAHWAIMCRDCRDCYFIEDSSNCSDCIMCSRLAHKQYCYKNKQLTKEEYEIIKAELIAGLETKLDEYKKEFHEIVITQPKKYSQILRSENCTGDNIFDSKNCQHCFMTSMAEDCKFCYDLNRGKDSYDITGFGIPIELVYESQNVGLGSGRCAFISFAYQLADSYYSEHCYYSKYLFGCVGAKNHAEYCILNKQYTKEEYEKKVAEIITNMMATPLRPGSAGQGWGEFFPAGFSSFGYNETMAIEYYPMPKEEAEKLGYFWFEQNSDIEFNGVSYEPLPIEKYKNDETERQKLLGGVLKCIKTGRPFKIMPQELLFYIKNNLPIPKVHWEQRMTDRLNLINRNILYHRQCDCEQGGHDHDGKKCEREFETTYSPNQPEKVYCENCYSWEEK